MGTMEAFHLYNTGNAGRLVTPMEKKYYYIPQLQGGASAVDSSIQRDLCPTGKRLRSLF